MKSSLLLLLLLSSALTIKLSEYNQEEIVEKVNSLKTTWTAQVYPPESQFNLGTIIEHEEHILPSKKLPPINDLPESYDLREVYPNCESIREIRDQGSCGSCFALACAETISDRICIKSGQTDQRRISAQDILSCGPFGTCRGGRADKAWLYFSKVGIVTGNGYEDEEYCLPYFLPKCNHVVYGDKYPPCPTRQFYPPICPRKCREGYPKAYRDDKIRGEAYEVFGVKDIMEEIYLHGSVHFMFGVYRDFLNYKSGIYRHVAGPHIGSHSVKCIGWGVENGVDYWIIANSWNEEWGENGFFRMIRGVNEGHIEGSALTGIPDI